MDDQTRQFYPEHVFKYCPRCGSKKFVFHRQKAFSCNDCGFRFFINASAAVAALIEDKRGRLLLTRRAKEPMKGRLDLPGGFVDVYETAKQALHREIKEELNLDIRDMRYFTSVPNTYLFAGITYFTLDLAFLCTADDFRTIAPRDDVIAYEFKAPGEIDIEEIGFVSIKKIVSEYLASKEHMVHTP